MMLICCPECGKEISDQAPTCIYCGYPLISEENERISKKEVQNDTSHPLIVPVESTESSQEPQVDSKNIDEKTNSFQSKKKKRVGKKVIIVIAIAIVIIAVALSTPTPEDTINKDVNISVFERSQEEVVASIADRLYSIDPNYTVEEDVDSNTVSTLWDVNYDGQWTGTSFSFANMPDNPEIPALSILCLNVKTGINHFFNISKVALMENDVQNRYNPLGDTDKDLQKLFDSVTSNRAVEVFGDTLLECVLMESGYVLCIGDATNNDSYSYVNSQDKTTPFSMEAPDPVVYTGSGDDVIEIEPPTAMFVLKITGNSVSNHFGVKGYDTQGNPTELFVNTTEPYTNGVTIDSTFMTTTLEIKATGEWSITVIPVQSLEKIETGTLKEGSGDQVFLISGNPHRANITGNSGAHYFGVIAHDASGRDVLVNTTEPYEGSVIISSDAVILEVKSEDSWKILLK